MDYYLQIGEFSERVGVSPDLLRAWERRYGLLTPRRSEGGFRLYGRDDAERVRRMVALIEDGVSAAEAARLAIDSNSTGVGAAGTGEQSISDGGALAGLLAAIRSFDEPAVHASLDRLLATYGVESVVRDVMLPALEQVGHGWASGTVTIGQEHFATGIIRARMLALARGWGQGLGPRAVLAAPAGEDHDIGLIAFGLALWRRGWRITFLGADTPLESMLEVVNGLAPEALVLSSVREEPLLEVADDLRQLATSTTIGLGGAGVHRDVADRIGATLLDTDVIEAADFLTASRAEGR